LSKENLANWPVKRLMCLTFFQFLISSLEELDIYLNLTGEDFTVHPNRWKASMVDGVAFCLQVCKDVSLCLLIVQRL